jgi:hypothetical protein
MERDLSDLTFGLALAFGFPIVVYLTGMAWNRVVGAPKKVNRTWASFCLLLPIVALGMMVQVGWSSFQRLWMTSPYVLATLTLVFGVIAPAALIAVIVRLWRTGPNHHDRM